MKIIFYKIYMLGIYSQCLTICPPVNSSRVGSISCSKCNSFEGPGKGYIFCDEDNSCSKRTSIKYKIPETIL
jgi:hypothetical protein